MKCKQHPGFATFMIRKYKVKYMCKVLRRLFQQSFEWCVGLLKILEFISETGTYENKAKLLTLTGIIKYTCIFLFFIRIEGAFRRKSFITNTAQIFTNCIQVSICLCTQMNVSVLSVYLYPTRQYEKSVV